MMSPVAYWISPDPDSPDPDMRSSGMISPVAYSTSADPDSSPDPGKTGILFNSIRVNSGVPPEQKFGVCRNKLGNLIGISLQQQTRHWILKT